MMEQMKTNFCCGEWGQCRIISSCHCCHILYGIEDQIHYNFSLNTIITIDNDERSSVSNVFKPNNNSQKVARLFTPCGVPPPSICPSALCLANTMGFLYHLDLSHFHYIHRSRFHHSLLVLCWHHLPWQHQLNPISTPHNLPSLSHSPPPQSTVTMLLWFGRTLPPKKL